MKGGKGTYKKMLCAASAACLAFVLACAVALALYPYPSGARYVESEVYEGEEIYVGEDADHGEHDDWVDLNASQSNGAEGVTWTTSSNGTVSCTISGTKQTDNSYYGKYYLSADLEANLTIGSDTDYDVINADLCLNGHALTGTTPLSIKYTGGNSQRCNKTTVNLYDCGGGEGVHYYKLRDDGVSYDFSSPDAEGNDVDEDNCDGYVRGGLITGGYSNDSGTGGGVTLVAKAVQGGSATLNMYGGTIAGNRTAGDGGGILVYCGEVNMYGGSIEGNFAGSSNIIASGETGGAGVCVLGPNNTYYTGLASFKMYGGTIRNNYSGSHGGGVEVNCDTTSSSAVFEMYGGSIEGNRAKYGGGVGMYDYYNDNNGNHATDAFRMYGGAIRDNKAEYSGGGIFVSNSGSEIEISGGTITGNVQEGFEEISGGATQKGDSRYYDDRRGGGIYFFDEDTKDNKITLSGTAYVYGNLCAGERCNIGLREGYFLTLGELEDGAKIGVTLIDTEEGQEGITDALDETYADALSACLGYIVSDDTSYKVAVNGEGTQLVLQKKKES